MGNRREDSIQKNRARWILWIGLLIVLMGLGNCTFRVVADYDPETVNGLFDLSQKVDLFYSLLLETDKDQRQYEKFKRSYVEIETSFRRLLLKNRLRPFNKETENQISIAMRLWEDDKQKHKEKDGVSDFIAKRHRAQYGEVFYQIIKGEQAKDIE